MSLREWFKEICIFQPEGGVLHLYLGTPKNPRTSLVIVKGKKILEPMRIPSHSIDVLTNRYKGGETRDGDLNSFSKFLLFIFGQKEFSLVYPTDPKLDLSVKDQDPGILPVIDINEYLSEVDTWVGTSIIPVNQELKDWLTADKITDVDEVFEFVKIVGSAKLSSRQSALSSLVKKRTDLSLIFLSLLFQTRAELDIALLRELSRQQFTYSLPSHLAHLWRTDSDPIRSYYSKLYLLSFEPEFIKKQKWYMDRQLRKHKQVLKTLAQRKKEIYFNLAKDQPQSSRAFLELILLFEEEIKLLELTSYLVNSNWSHVDSSSYRSALMYVVKFAEFVNKPILVGIILALAFVGRKTVMGSSLTRNLGSMGYELNYVVRRISSLLNIWKQTGQQKKVEESIFNLLKCYPNEQIVSRKEITSQITEKWFDIHPVFGTYKPIIDDYSNSSNKLLELIPFIFKNKNPFLQKWLTSSIVIKTDNNTGLPHLVPLHLHSKKKLSLPEDYFLKQNIHMITQYHYPISHEFLEFCKRWNLSLSTSIFSRLVDEFQETETISLPVIIDYLREIGSQHKSQVSKYFGIFKKVITPDLIEQPTSKQKNMILTLVIPWSQITSSYPSDEQQEFIDALKIIYQEELQDFDLESSRSLSIETLVMVYQLTKGEIPRFVEANIQFSFTKPVWEQMARHYLAMGLQRPQNAALKKSKLKEVPQYLTRDVLGQIAIVNQTIAYCQRNGFRAPLENLIVKNLYHRGWNVERRLERTLPALFGGLSPRLRSYLAAYLVIDSGEVGKDVLKLARDVENHQLRDRLMRELDRYATPDMWITIAEAYHQDITKMAIENLKDTRMSASQRSSTIRGMILSSNQDLRDLGMRWMHKYGVQQDDAFVLLSSNYEDTWENSLKYILKSNFRPTDTQQQLLVDIIEKILWTTNLRQSTRKQAMDAITLISEPYKTTLESSLKTLFSTQNHSLKGIAIQALSKLGDDV